MNNEKWVDRPIIDITKLGDDERTFAYAPNPTKEKMIHSHTWTYRIKRFFKKYFTWSK